MGCGKQRFVEMLLGYVGVSIHLTLLLIRGLQEDTDRICVWDIHLNN
jgi:hypothetical protein